MSAYDLLKQLMTMIDAVDFNRCTSSRGFKGQYDVWLLKRADDLMFLEREAEKETPPNPQDTVTVVESGPALVPLEQFVKESTQPDEPA